MPKLIIVSGFAGSGKSTLAEKLAKHFGLGCVHASDLLRKLKDRHIDEVKHEKTVPGSGFWESEEGKAYLEKRLQDHSMDKTLDKELLKIAKHGNVVLDSWTMPWLCKSGFKAWLNTSIDVRAQRVALRDNLPFMETKQKLLERDEKTAEIYFRIYGFKLGEDFKPFHLVLKTDGLQPSEVFEKVKSAAEQFFGKKKKTKVKRAKSSKKKKLKVKRAKSAKKKKTKVKKSKISKKKRK